MFVHGVLSHVVAWDVVDSSVDLKEAELLDSNNGIHEDEEE